MSKFWELMKNSTITQGLVTLVLTGTVCYLAISGQPVPELIAYGFSSVVGFFFGAKIQQVVK